MYKFEFKEDDLFINRLKAYPDYEIFIYQGKQYINREKHRTDFKGGPVATGLTVFELNRNTATGENLAFPFIRSSARHDDFKARMYNPINVRSSDNGAFAGQNVPASSFSYQLDNKIALSGAYSGSAKISRTITSAQASKTKRIFNRSTGLASEETVVFPRATNVTASALQNVARKYSHLSKHFNFLGQDGYIFDSEGSAISASSNVIPDRNLTRETVNMVFIPQMFYGSTIKKGSVVLDYYYTGSLVASCHDKNHNGELIGTSGSTTGAVVGIVLYDEGIIMLTSSKDLDDGRDVQYQGGGDVLSGSWLRYGTTLNDGVAISEPGVGNVSYGLNFKGTNYVTSMTMMAHAGRGQLNHSNNPSYRDLSEATSYTVGKGEIFSEGNLKIKNITSASYTSASFEKTTYISKVRIYDDQNNLIGVASMANPVKKTMDRAYTFKLKLDI
jgi:hypothetical protein